MLKEKVSESSGVIKTVGSEEIRTRFVPGYLQVVTLRVDRSYRFESVGTIFVNGDRDCMYIWTKNNRVRITKNSNGGYTISQTSTPTINGGTSTDIALNSYEYKCVTNDNSLLLIRLTTGDTNTYTYYMYDSKTDVFYAIPSSWPSISGPWFATDSYLGSLYHSTGTITFVPRGNVNASRSTVTGIPSGDNLVGVYGDILWCARLSERTLIVDEINLASSTTTTNVIRYNLGNLVSSFDNVYADFICYRNGTGYAWLRSEISAMAKALNGVIKIDYISKSVDISGLSATDVDTSNYRSPGRYIGTDFDSGTHYMSLPDSGIGYFTDEEKQITRITEIDFDNAIDLSTSYPSNGGDVANKMLNYNYPVATPITKVYQNISDSVIYFGDFAIDMKGQKAYSVELLPPYESEKSRYYTTLFYVIGQKSPSLISPILYSYDGNVVTTSGSIDTMPILTTKCAGGIIKPI